MKRRARKLAIRWLGSLIVSAIAGGWFISYELQAVSRFHRAVPIRIKPGTSISGVAHTLKQAGLIRSETVFVWYARSRGDVNRLKAGYYRLSPDMSVARILDRLKRGGSDAEGLAVTIPEGFTLRQIADSLAAKRIITDREAFLKIVQSTKPPLTAPFPLPLTGLEGYLFPETYRFSATTRPEKVAQVMLDTFTREFYEPHRADIDRSGHSLHEIVTIASLIEREAEIPADRAKIAGVIENRLKMRMRLQIDATVLYALGHHKNRVLYADLETPSPYNTYKHAGLPPGPIASPGEACLEAALAPERHDYLYYVAGPGGAHIFSRTEAEHLRVVARLRAARATQ